MRGIEIAIDWEAVSDQSRLLRLASVLFEEVWDYPNEDNEEQESE